MMHHVGKNLAVILFTTSMFGGCAATQTVSNPNTITLKNALVDTVDALNAAHAEAKKNGQYFGFYGCSVTAVYNISATATQDNKLTLSASGPPATVVPISIGSTLSSEATASGTRGNTVTVVFNTKYCMPNGGNAKSGKGGGLEKPPIIFVQPPPSW